MIQNNEIIALKKIFFIVMTYGFLETTSLEIQNEENRLIERRN